MTCPQPGGEYQKRPEHVGCGQLRMGVGGAPVTTQRVNGFQTIIELERTISPEIGVLTR